MSVLPQENASVSISAVDLFCGVGGLTHGLQKAGINVIKGIDVDPTCKYAYEKNNKARFIEKDIREVTGNEISALYSPDDVKLLVGCAPCQPFAALPQNRKEPVEKDVRWGLLYEFARLIQEVQPQLVVFENITPIRKERVFVDFIEKLYSLGYHFNPYPDFVYCPDYGIPQKRRRLIVIASIWDKVSLSPKTHSCSQEDGFLSCPTVRETIEDLPKIDAGEVCLKDPLHRARKLTDKNIERIKRSKQGGTWEDWDENLRTPCHRKSSGRTYKSVYGRMEWDEPSPTITTQFHNYGSGRFGHPEQHRALSFREGALLQTFPRNYDFVEPGFPFSIKQIGTFIGNAVPVKLATVIGKSIQRHVKEHYHE